MKLCKSCLVEKDESEFYKMKGYLRGVCKECRCKGQQKYNAEARKSDPNYYKKETSRKAVMKWRLREKFGLTVEQFEAMVAEQGGVCKICGEPPSGRYTVLCVDHCHETGQVRGLLCNRCNTHLGWFEANRAQTLKYLENTHG